MAQNPDESPTILSTLGEELIRIIAPVSTCMLLVVLLVSTLSSSSSSSSYLLPSFPSSSSSSSSSSSVFWDDLKGAIFSSLAFVAAITIATFLIVLLFYIRCTNCLKSYMAFTSFIVLAFLGGDISLALISSFSIPIDSLTFSLSLLNFSVVGVLAVFLSRMPIVVTQTYLVSIGVLVAYWFTMLPEWTTWALLIAMALYDLAAVLLPGGPLRLLVELAISRDEEIPALVYEARPVGYNPGSNRRVWRNSEPLPVTTRLRVTGEASTSASRSLSPLPLISEATLPLLARREEQEEEEGANGIGLGSSGAIKLGLGDFIFYSVLVGRAALYDLMTVYACYLAIIAGLGITLLLLAFYRRALPALPVSIALGILFYALTRLLLEVFVVQCSVELLMF